MTDPVGKIGFNYSTDLMKQTKHVILVGEWLSFAKFMYECQIFISSLPNINWLKYILTVGKIYRFNRLRLKAT